MEYKDDIFRAATLDIPWGKLSGCNILVTGATGLIGSCIIDVLMTHPNRDYNVYACGRNEKRIEQLFSQYLNDSHFYFVRQDITIPLACDTIFHYIIHAASGAAPSDFSLRPVEVMKANLLGIINLMEYGREHQLKRFLYVSSGEVYGEGDGRLFTEDYSGYVNPMMARSCYPSSKRAAETLCASYGAEYGVDYVVARPCHIYGPNFTENDNRVYAQFIRNVIVGENIVMKSTGAQFRSWCYVVDCVSALLHILLKGENGQAYNVADESSNISIRELAEMIAEIGGQKVIIESPSEKEKAGFNVVNKSIFSADKLYKLGWDVKKSMKMNIKATIEFLMKNIRNANFN